MMQNNKVQSGSRSTIREESAAKKLKRKDYRKKDETGDFVHWLVPTQSDARDDTTQTRNKIMKYNTYHVFIYIYETNPPLNTTNA